MLIYYYDNNTNNPQFCALPFCMTELNTKRPGNVTRLFLWGPFTCQRKQAYIDKVYNYYIEHTCVARFSCNIAFSHCESPFILSVISTASSVDSKLMSQSKGCMQKKFFFGMLKTICQHTHCKLKTLFENSHTYM